VHSFAFKEKDSKDRAAKTEYGEVFSSIVSRENIIGVQFHPEKSQKAGKLLIKNFLSI
jgi:glutamine amidotransferase